VSLLFTVVWVSRVDPVEFMRAQIEESPRAGRMTPEQKAQVVETQARFFKPIAFASSLLFTPLIVVAIAGFYLLVFRFFMGDDVVFRQSLAVVAWTLFPVAIVTSLLTLLTLALKGEWSIDPRHALQANLALALDRETAPRALYALAESFDLFTFWQVALLSLGFAAATRRRPSSAAYGVVGLWMVWVVLKVGFAFVMSML
jgi:Yip1-like protein